MNCRTFSISITRILMTEVEWKYSEEVATCYIHSFLFRELGLPMTQLVFSSQELLIPRCGLAIASISRLSEYSIKGTLWVNLKPSLREWQRSVTLLCYPLLSNNNSSKSASLSPKRSTSAKFPTSRVGFCQILVATYSPIPLSQYPLFAHFVRDALKRCWGDGDEL